MLPLITALLPIVGEVIDRVIPDKGAADKAKLEMQAKILDAANQGALAQIEVNKEEAKHASIFVAGWRPFIGWSCGAGLAWAFVAQPLVNWVILAFGLEVASVPVLPTDSLMELVVAMLGLGTLRTFEKVKGATK
jgi:hypothetical protein